MPKILIVDDEEAIRQTLEELLQYEGYETASAPEGQSGLKMLLAEPYDVVISDIRMPKMNGIELLEAAQAQGIPTPFIMISGHADIDTAVEATKKGAYDFLEKPPDMNRLLLSARNASERNTLVAETKRLRKRITGGTEMIGSAPGMMRVKETIERVAPSEARVLITGPNGSGKELVARQIHEKSNRNRGPMIEVNCAAIPSELIESELFGHEKGAFTSAVRQHIGKFEQANGGTLFLDEIGDMSLSAQAKVLRVLEDGKITRIGSEKSLTVDVRVVAATNKNLELEMETGRFRVDLYHRLCVIPIHMPPLRERREDIPDLARHFLREIAAATGRVEMPITQEAMEELSRLEWRGNVRELRNVMERLSILSSNEITAQDVLDFAAPPRPRSKSAALYQEFDKFQDFKDFVEKEFILAKLEANQWNVSKTAEVIDIQRSHLYNKMDKYHIRREEG